MATDRQKLIVRLDSVFSQFIRLRDAGKDGGIRCVSCGQRFEPDYIDCGHYIPREHMATRFSEMNCHAQCHFCNRQKRGNLEAYRDALVTMYGEDAVEALEQRKFQAVKMGKSELQDKLDFYRDEVKLLRLQKPNVKI